MKQGPRSNFEIGGGGGGGGGRGRGIISDSILGAGDTKHFFLLILYNFKNIGGGGRGGGTCPPPPPPYSVVPVKILFSVFHSLGQSGGGGHVIITEKPRPTFPITPVPTPGCKLWHNC